MRMGNPQIQNSNTRTSKFGVIAFTSACFLLAACGGGSPKVQSGSGGIVPNSVLLSDMVVSIGGVEDRITNVICSADLSQCQATYSGQSFSFTPTGGGNEPDVGEAYSTVGEWNHMISGIVFTQSQGAQARMSVSGGITHPGSIPSRLATWTGDMVAFDSNSRVVRGGASIKLTDFSDPRVDIRLTPQSRTAMEWQDLPVRNGGFSDSQATSTYIKGEFYGPGAEETGGVFERNGLIGAFGANR